VTALTEDIALEQDPFLGDTMVHPDIMPRLRDISRELEQLAQIKTEPAHLIRPPIWWFRFPIAGIERTQSTQFFRFNNKGSGNASNNTVPLVAKKDLILRVYVRSNSPFWPHTPTTVTGKLSSPGQPDLGPINGSITAMTDSSIDRGNANHTLNFRVPASRCVGTVSFTLTVYDPAFPSDVSSPFLSTTFSLTFDDVPLMRVHGVLIHYTGRGLDIPAPNGFDLINTLDYVWRSYPISSINYTACEVVEFNGDLTVGGGGGCGTGWNQLFNMLWNMRVASGTNDVFVGLLPPGVPTSGVIGCGGGGVAIAYNDGGSVLAQEIGHAFGRAHAPCGNPGGPDPNYPVYDSYPSGSIGEFGFHNGTLQVFDPAGTFDFMSYCGPTWISPYTYVGLKNGIAASPAAAHPERAGSRQVAREYLYLNFRMQHDGKVELLPSFHLFGHDPSHEHSMEESAVGCDLLDKHDNILESHRCSLTNPHMHPADPVVEFHEVVPWHEGIEKIAFYRNGQLCHTLEVEEAASEISLETPKSTERRSELLRLEWSVKRSGRAKASLRPLYYLVRYSHDGGQTWRALASDLTETRFVVNLDLLPGGETSLFQVIASSGVHTSVATTKPIAVPQKARAAHILTPKSGTTIKQGEEAIFLGGGFSPDFGMADLEDITWSSNRDGVLGFGYQLATTQLSLGRHHITVSIPDGLGGEASRSINIQIK
jgi:hypothetical protein